MKLIERQPLEGDIAGLRTEEMLLNMGPQHPSTHGVLRLVLQIAGENVVGVTPVIGYLHRGVEKILENRTYLQGVRYTDNMHYLSQMLGEHAFVGAVEQLMGLEVPRRAEYIRVIADELQRITSHLVWLGCSLMDLGAFTPINYCFRDRDEILSMFETLGGSRFNVNYMRVGGVLADLPEGFLSRLEKFLGRFVGTLDELEALIGGNEIFMVRTMNVGYMSPELGIAYGVVGPCLRGSGVDLDIRTYRPYSVYPELGVQPQIALEGDCYARYKVRMNEMRESVRLIRLAMANLPGGAVRARIPHLIRPPKGEAYFSVESGHGEIGYYIISDGGTNPFRAKVRPACFANLQVLPELLHGCRIGDVVAILSSIDIYLGEVDR